MAINQQKIKQLILEMTLDEKLAQLGSYWMYDLQSGGKLNDQLMSQKLGSGIGQITRVAGASASPPQPRGSDGQPDSKIPGGKNPPGYSGYLA